MSEQDKRLTKPKDECEIFRKAMTVPYLKASQHEESYPPQFKHCMIHLNPETGEMYSHGDHDVRLWIQSRLADLAALREEVAAVKKMHNGYADWYEGDPPATLADAVNELIEESTDMARNEGAMAAIRELHPDGKSMSPLETIQAAKRILATPEAAEAEGGG